MLEKTHTFPPPHKTRKNSEDCFKLQELKYPRTTNSWQYERELVIALPEGNSEDKNDSSLLIRLLK